MPHSTLSFDLCAVYARAEHLTIMASGSLRAGDGAQAFALLEQRTGLIRSIQRGAGTASKWGTDPKADAAALRYLAADRELEAVLDALEA